MNFSTHVHWHTNQIKLMFQLQNWTNMFLIKLSDVKWLQVIRFFLSSWFTLVCLLFVSRTRGPAMDIWTQTQPNPMKQSKPTSLWWKSPSLKDNCSLWTEPKQNKGLWNLALKGLSPALHFTSADDTASNPLQTLKGLHLPHPPPTQSSVGWAPDMLRS